MSCVSLCLVGAEGDRAAEGVAACEDGGVAVAALAYDGEDAARALAVGELPQGDGRGLSAPDEVGEEGRGVFLLDEALVEQEVGGLEPYVGFEAGVAAQGHGPVPGGCAFGFHHPGVVGE